MKQTNQHLLFAVTDLSNLLGGTAWLWARDDMVDSLDVLFVDEASQLSLAHTLGAARCARNLVLLGDPQQLEQPQRAVHPEGAEVAALIHLLDGRKTLPDDRGLFLDVAQVAALENRLPAEVRVGTVDRFQGQEAPVVIYSATSSSARDAPRGMSFLFNPNRLNVATSRARCVCILVASPRLLEPDCRTPEQMRHANGLCRYRELATEVRFG